MHSFLATRSMGLSVLALLTGMVVAQQLPVLPDLLWCLAALPALWLAWRIAWLRLPAYALVGFLWAVASAHHLLSTGLPGALEGRDVSVVGVIASLPQSDVRRTRFQFDVIELRDGERLWPAPGRVVLSWYDAAPALTPGETWQLTVRLKRPHAMLNPGGFDYEAWMFRHRLRASGYVRAQASNERLAVESAGYAIPRWRHAIAEAIQQALPGSAHAGVIEALAVGERRHIPVQQWDTLLQTGTNHLVAISGLHVGLIAGLALLIVRHAWARWPAAALRWPAAKAGAVAALLAAAGYAAMAGFAVPTQRALVMLAVVLLSVLAQREIRPFHTLAWALLVVLMWDPLAVIEAGFWLSFGAVVAIVYAFFSRTGRRGGWRSWGRVQLVVVLGLLPLTLLLFQQVSLVAPLANLIAVPWVSLVVVPLSLVGAAAISVAPTLGAELLVLANGAMALLWPLLESMQRWKLAWWWQHAPPVWTLLPGMLGVLCLLAPRGLSTRLLGVVLVLPLFLALPPRPPTGEAWFTMLDVGQGLAAVVRTRNHTLVYDTGPRYSERFDSGAAAVLPYLRYAGVRDIDVLVVSHGDNDHLGGAAAVLAGMPVAKIFSSVPERLAGAQWCRAGQRWHWDNVDFEMLYPTAREAGQGNDASCVLRVSAGGQRLLLSGDIEARSERKLLATRSRDLAAEVLVAPHHGSKTSSTPGFVAAVRPRYVLFPVGYRNRYGFPKEVVAARYARAGAVALDSARDGAISLRLGATPPPPPVRQRIVQQRYWHSRLSVAGPNQYH